MPPALLLFLRRLRRKIAFARLDLHVLSIHFNLEWMIRAILLHVTERELEQVFILRPGGQARQSALQIIVVAEESSTGAVSKFGHHLLVLPVGIAAILDVLSCDEGLDRFASTLARRNHRRVESARVESADGDRGSRGQRQPLEPAGRSRDNPQRASSFAARSTRIIGQCDPAICCKRTSLVLTCGNSRNMLNYRHVQESRAFGAHG